MFRLEESHEFDWPVDIRKPVGVDERGRPKFETHRMVATFRALPLDEAAGAMEADGETPREPLMERVLIGWDGIADEAGEALPCTPENVRKLCRIGYVGAALTEAYFRALTGRSEKN